MIALNGVQAIRPIIEILERGISAAGEAPAIFCEGGRCDFGRPRSIAHPRK
jgi:hypothetical protein